MIHEIFKKIHPPGGDLVAVMQHRAKALPDQVASTFLGSEHGVTVEKTYAQIDAQARAIAEQLVERGLTGERAMLVFDPGLDFVAAFLGCLYSGTTAVPAYPPDPMRLHRTLERLQAIVDDSQAAVLVTTGALNQLCSGIMGRERTENALVVDDLVSPIGNFSSPAFGPKQLALLQYTSGSTGTPKGVMVTHGNLLANLRQVHECIDLPTSSIACWLPVYHDMGLIAGVLQPWYSGRFSVLMSPLHFFQQPLRWLQAVSDYRITTTVAPDFGYELCLRKIKPAEHASLDLTCWTIAMNGSESVRRSTIDNFVEAFHDCGVREEIFYPCYGLAEATLFVTGGQSDDLPDKRSFDGEQLSRGVAVESRDGRTLVGCGAAILGQEMCIVDPQKNEVLGENQVGEIWLRGENVADGYWRKPEASASTFEAYTIEGGGPYLRTGDMGFVCDSELFITGRIKDVLIVWGQNHFAEDIEQTVEACDEALKSHGGAAFSVDDGQRERVIVVHEVVRPRRVDLQQIISKIARDVAVEHHVPIDAIVLIKAGSLPKTTSGKVQRSKCRELYLADKLAVVTRWETDRTPIDPITLAENYVAPRTATEEILAEIWAEVLGVPQVGIYDSFFDLGGHSLLATRVAERLTRWVPGELALESLLDRPTVAELATWIDQQSIDVQDENQLAGLLDRIDELSEKEAMQLLRSDFSLGGGDRRPDCSVEPSLSLLLGKKADWELLSRQDEAVSE
jgi:acyl-CoA synthetase (AMP-forming)/AMP-acid ligase II